MQSVRTELADVWTAQTTVVRASFASAEHLLLGGAATGNEVLTELAFKDGTRLTFGEVVALAGDFVGSVDELRQLMATEQGQAELLWTRWFAFGQKEPEPKLASDIKRRIVQRYGRMAADNSNHFNQNGAALAAYARGHTEALRKAFEAGATGNAALFASAVTEEAFSQHFLSDTFAAGHIRAPVAEIRETYRRELPDSVDRALRYVIRRVIEHLAARGDVPWYWPHSLIERKAIETIQRAAGTLVQATTLGDLVVFAWHDADGRGLDVVSAVDPSGTPVPGGFRWRAQGDGQLDVGSTAWRMALGAMKASRGELDAARALGAAQPHRGAPSWGAARPFIPSADTAKNPVFAWRWGAMNDTMVDALNTTLREVLVPKLRGYPPDPPVLRLDRFGNPDPNGPVVLHVGEAFEALVRELEVDGLAMVERAVSQSATGRA